MFKRGDIHRCVSLPLPLIQLDLEGALEATLPPGLIPWFESSQNAPLDNKDDEEVGWVPSHFTVKCARRAKWQISGMMPLSP